MASRRSPRNRKAVWVALGVSCVAHLLVLVELAHWIGAPDEPEELSTKEATSKPAKKLNVQMTTEPEPAEVETRKQQKEKKEEKDEPEKKEPRRDYDRKSVVQKTDKENPDEADYVSEQANKVEKETRARKTTNKPVEPTKNPSEQKNKKSKESPEEKKRGSRKVASRAEPKPKRKPPAKPKRPSPSEEKQERSSDEKPSDAPKQPKSKSEKAPKPSSDSPPPLPMPSPDDYGEVFNERKDRQKMKEHAEKGVGSDLFKKLEKQDGAVRAAMENYIGEVQPGNHTAVNAHADAAATYINRIHAKIHPQWGGEFLPRLDRNFGPSSPLSDSDLNAVLEFVVDGVSGKLEEVTIVKSSGVTTYDMEAVSIAKTVAPHSEAPQEIRSPDGNVYLHWNFWRDQRQCGTFGVSIYKLLDDGTKKKTR